MDPYEEFLLTIRRDINCLGENDRVVRRNALVKLEKTVRAQRKVSDDIILRAFLEELHKPLLRLLADPGEKCRELSLDLLGDFIAQLSYDQLSDLLPLLLAAVLGRIRALPFPEQSEEIRLEILTLIETIFNTAKELIIPFTHDIVDALAKALTDNCPDAKKKCCALVTRITTITDPARLANCAAPLVHSLVQTLRHQHWKVRKCALESLKDLLCSVETFELLGDLIPHLAPILTDRTPQIRLCLSQCLHTWLLRGMALRWPGKPPDFDNLDAEIDFEKYEHRLLYLLISVIADEEQSVAEVAFGQLEEIAKESEERQRKTEEEKRRKEKEAKEMELNGDEEMKDGDAMSVDEPTNKKPIAAPPVLELDGPKEAWYRKPSVSTALYVGSFFNKLIPQILNSLLEWTTTQQIYACRLLKTLLGLAPQRIPPYLEHILVHLYRAAVDETLDAATMIGLFVAPDLVIDLVSQHLGLRGTGGQGANYGVSEVVGRVTCRQLQSISQAKNFVATTSETKFHVLKIFDKILEARIIEDAILVKKVFFILDAQAQQEELHEVTLRCVEALVLHDPAWISELWDEIFDIGLIVMQSASLQQRIDQLLEKVAAKTDRPLSDMYAAHLEAHMGDLLGGDSTQKMWPDNSPKAHILDALLRRATIQTLGKCEDYFTKLVPVLACQASQDASANRRCDLLGLVHFLLKKEELRESMKCCALGLTMEVIMPNAVWRPGQSNNKIRKGALVCILAVLEARILDPADLTSTVMPTLTPILKSAMDDSWSPDNRLVSCLVITHGLDNLLVVNFPVPDDLLREIYPELLKRMDDSNDEIRKAVCDSFVMFFKCLPPRWSDSLYEYIIHALFIHLDDPSPQLQSAVYNALEVSLHYNPDKFISEAKSAHAKASHPRRCQDLVRLAESLKVCE